jgi:tetratricopeptide (TPR) repeat protein
MKIVVWMTLAFLACSLTLQGQERVRTILVFPFENQSGRPDLNWISEGFANVLSSRLAGSDRYVLGREERNAAYNQLGIPPDIPLTLASEYKVAQVLGVDWAVIGDFTVAGRRLTGHARLLDMHNLRLHDTLEVSGGLDDLVELQTNLAWRLLATQDPDFTVGTEEDFASRFPPIRLDAFENYIRGILAPTEEARIRFLKEADRLSPQDHSAAYVLGKGFFEHKEYAESAKWLKKIAPHDEFYLESVFLLSVDQFFLGQEASAEKGFAMLSGEIPLNEIWNNLAVLQARRGDYPDALASLERAYQGDPTDPDFCFNLGTCLWYMQRYPDAAQYLQQAVHEDEGDAEAHTLLAIVYKKMGDPPALRQQLHWLAAHEGMLPGDVPSDILPQARLKKNFDGRAFRLLSLAIRHAIQERLAKKPQEKVGQLGGPAEVRENP